MEEILEEIGRAVTAGYYYVAVALTLALPDICAALESASGRTDGARYKEWCRVWLAKMYGLTPRDFYSMRCGVLHQGNLGLRHGKISRVAFTLRNGPDGNIAHDIVAELGADLVLNLDAVTFCEDVASAVRRWWVAKENDRHVVANLPRLFRMRPNGLAPYINGIPVIA